MVSLHYQNRNRIIITHSAAAPMIDRLKRMINAVSKRRPIRPASFFLVVAASAANFFLFSQSVNSFVLQGARPDAFPGNLMCGSNSNCDKDGDHSIIHEIFGGSDYDDDAGAVSFQPSTRRRQILATMALVAPVVWSFPETAPAKSVKSSNKQQDEQAKSKDRPIDAELSEAVQKMFDLDEPNRLIPGRDYAVNTDNKRKAADGNDTETAQDPLFRYVDAVVFEKRPTYKTFLALLDNYQPSVCLGEDNTSDERKEAYAFLKACMATPVLKFCYSYCKSKLEREKGVAEAASAGSPKKLSFDTEDEFVDLLYKIWFQLYSRSKGCGGNNSDDENNESGDGGNKAVYGSSGFEHVFVGEIRDGKVIGFHNWIQLYLQEKAGNGKLAYRGRKGGSDRVLTYKLLWKGAEKPFGTSLLGVSPEFELALYTMVFLVGSKDNILLLDLGDSNAANAAANASGNDKNDRAKTKLDVKCFKSRGRVGSCYVELLPQ